MSPEALLTFFGLLVAAYSILPTERRLDLRVRLGTIDWMIVISAILIVHYILLFPVLDALHIAPHLGTWRFGFEPDTASYLVLAGAGVLVGVRGKTSKL